MIDYILKEAIINVKVIISYLGKNTSAKHYQVLVSLADQYLAVEGFPKEKIIAQDLHVNEFMFRKGFNEALHLCKLAAMKQKNEVSSEQIGGLICQKNTTE